MILDAWGWCTGTTQRDGMGREEGGGFRMGNTGIPVMDSFKYLAKLIKYCKVKKKKSINSLELSFLHSPTLTAIHDHWKNHSLV